MKSRIREKRAGRTPEEKAHAKWFNHWQKELFAPWKQSHFVSRGAMKHHKFTPTGEIGQLYLFKIIKT